jgi:hypothetical protein
MSTTATKKRCGRVTYWRDGQSFQCDRSREMPVKEALAHVAKYGYTKVRLNSGVLENNRLVIVLSEYMPRGHEYCRLIYSRGKYPGNCAGSVHREGDL